MEELRTTVMRIGKAASDAFATSFKSLLKQKLSPQTAFKIRGIAQAIALETEKYNGAKTGIVNEYAIRNDAGEVVRPTPETVTIDPLRMSDFLKKMKELDSIEIKVPTLWLSELGDPEKLTMLTEDYVNLEFIQG